MYSHLSAAVAVEQTDDHYHRAALSRRSRAARTAARDAARKAAEEKTRRTDRVALPRPAGETRPARA